MSDLPFASATSLVEALRGKRISSRELLDIYLHRIERYNPKVNAVVTLDEEAARTEALRADEDLARGTSHGPLHGLPMTIKDSFETAGMRTTCGAPELAQHVPTRDADAVARLRAAGAVIFGKTNVPIYTADVQSYNEVFGTTNNPWDTARIPGGSSGGAAAALAAGLTGFELGSDIGGSIRNPAHYCGVYGHKPTHSIISARGHIPGPPGTLAPADIAVTGPLGRSADDLDLDLDVLAGPDAAAAVAWRLELPPPRRTSLREYRLAAWLDDPWAPVDAPVRARLEAAVEALRAAGVRVDDRARPGFTLEEAARVFETLLNPVVVAGVPDDTFSGMAAAAAALPPGDDAAPARFLRTATLRHRDWLRANEARHRLRARWAEFFCDYDVLLCPAMPTAAFPHDHAPDAGARTVSVNGEQRRIFEGIAWAGFAGVCLLPATVAPVGRTPEGLPVGVQIVAPYLEDRTAIDIARRMAGVIGGFEPPPGYEERAQVTEGAQR